MSEPVNMIIDEAEYNEHCMACMKISHINRTMNQIEELEDEDEDEDEDESNQ
jgi:hypothetical protein